MQQIDMAAYNSGLGDIWVGLTDLYVDGQFKYWSSGRDYDSAGAAWPTYNLDGILDCVATYNGSKLNDQRCTDTNYAS